MYAIQLVLCVVIQSQNTKKNNIKRISRFQAAGEKDFRG